MGCDFNWMAMANEEQQRLCGWFLESLFDADENGVSRRFPKFVKFDGYNGEYTGIFMETGPLEDRGPLQDTVQLIGGTIHSGYYEDSEPGIRLWATDQISFVFLKVGDDEGELVTVEPVTDLTKVRYERIRERFEYAGDEESFRAIFHRCGRDRLIDGAGWFASLLYSIQKQLLPSLVVLDDYGIFDELVENEAEIMRDLTYSILKPELAAKWGWKFDSIETVISRIGTLLAVSATDSLVNTGAANQRDNEEDFKELDDSLIGDLHTSAIGVDDDDEF